MFEITKYFLPAACFLLITVFFMLLPDLRICKLGGGARRMDRADALVVAGVTIVYAVGEKPLTEEAFAFNLSAPEFYCIGDCVSPANIIEATSTAFTMR